MQLRFCLALLVGFATLPAGAQRLASAQSPNASDSIAQDGGTETDREDRIAEYLTNCKFVGRFTVDGRDDASPRAEEYVISKCERLEADNTYRLTARIKYGDVDSEVPIQLQILWAGNTPVITLDSIWIPGMGTFSSRVLIRGDRYSGTWQHDEKGGHLFGKVVQLEQ